MVHVLCFLVLIVVANSVNLQEYEEDPPLPELPDQFYMTIEANNKSDNTTVYMKKFYDGPGNRLAASMFADNIYTYITYDFNKLQSLSVIWVEDGAKCKVSTLTNDSIDVFGAHYEGKAVHIKNTTEFMRFGKQFNETYLGQEYVRGIPVDHWVANISNGNGPSIDIHYYFSIKWYNTTANETQIPVRAVITYPSGNISYEFFDVHLALPRWERVFEPPIGVSCIGRKNNKELPKLPDQFSMRGEFLGSRHKQIHSFSAYYNYPGKMTAFAILISRSDEAYFIKLVHDFNYGLSYWINEDVGSCNVSTINVTGHRFPSPDVVVAPDGTHVLLQDPTSFFIPPNLTWAYEGKSNLRGMDVESWISEPNDSHWKTNLIIEIFFAPVNYSFITFPSNITHFPVQKVERFIVFNATTKRNESFKITIEVFAFEDNISGPFQRHFDTSICIDKDNQMPLAFDLTGSENYRKYVQNNTRNFYFVALDSIATAARLPESRVAHLEVEEGTDQVLSIFFTILGVPKIQGNAVNSSQNHILSVKDAKENIETVINGNVGLVITVLVDGKNKSLKVEKGTLRQEFSSSNSESNAGATVGVAIVTFITGLFIGAIVVVIMQKKFNLRIPYQRVDD